MGRGVRRFSVRLSVRGRYIGIANGLGIFDRRQSRQLEPRSDSFFVGGGGEGRCAQVMHSFCSIERWELKWLRSIEALGICRLAFDGLNIRVRILRR